MKRLTAVREKTYTLNRFRTHVTRPDLPDHDYTVRSAIRLDFDFGFRLSVKFHPRPERRTDCTSNTFWATFLYGNGTSFRIRRTRVPVDLPLLNRPCCTARPRSRNKRAPSARVSLLCRCRTPSGRWSATCSTRGPLPTTRSCSLRVTKKIQRAVTSLPV